VQSLVRIVIIELLINRFSDWPNGKTRNSWWKRVT